MYQNIAENFSLPLKYMDRERTKPDSSSERMKTLDLKAIALPGENLGVKII